MSPTIVKLGGSLAGSDELPKWLDVIAGAGAGKVVIVPGGGPWADEVRQAQKREGFDDREAHVKALRAMEQYGKMLAGMRANLVPAADIAEIQAVLRDDRIPVWMPCGMVRAETAIPATWDVTSDSLAAWLAGQLNACALLLVKSLKVHRPQPSIASAMHQGWLDAAFAGFTAGAEFPIVLLGQGDQKYAESWFTTDG